MKNKEIKTKPKKVKINLNDWLNIANKCIGNHKKDLNILNRLWKNLTKKDKKDYEKEICKEIIQRLDQKKTLPEESQQIALQSSQILQNSQKDLPKTFIYLLGGGAMVLFSLVFLVLRSPRSLNIMDWVKDIDVILWLPLLIINLIIFIKGLEMQKKSFGNLMAYSLLAQSAISYTYCKARGQGGTLFEAYNYLETLRQKNRESLKKQLPWSKKKN